MEQGCIFKLSNEEREVLHQELAKIPYEADGNTCYITKVRIAALRVMPETIVKCLNEQKSSINPLPYLILENLPMDDFVRTTPNPTFFNPDAKSGCISENLAIAIAASIGEPYSIFFEGQDIVNNLIPTVQTKRDYTGLGSEVELDFHIENAALKSMGENNFSPLGLVLTGVSHDPHGPLTHIADSRKALDLLSEKDIAFLRQPLYQIKVPYRWRLLMHNTQQTTHPVPLIQGSLDFPEVSAVFYPDMMTPLSNSAAIAMKNFYQAIQEVSFGLDITPGRLVYIDNRFTLHARDAFTPSLDEKGNPRRWIQRVFVAPNLWNHRHLSSVKSRVFKPVEV